MPTPESHDDRVGLARTRGDGRGDRRPVGVLAGMRVRKKLVFLHTMFWITLALVLVLALRPAVARIVRETEAECARLLLTVLAAQVDLGSGDAEAIRTEMQAIASGICGAHASMTGAYVGSAESLGVGAATRRLAMETPGRAVLTEQWAGGPASVVYDASSGLTLGASVRVPGARRSVVMLYVLLTVALLGVYALVALSLELFVLPRNVYEPIRRILHADRAVQEGRRREEIIPEQQIPRDELGEIMRSRNEAIRVMRRHEHDLGDALSRLEVVASDLKRKNHLIETARRNMAETDRLASLGMMSAGIAHEMNTPLAVLKGLVEQLNDPAREVSPSERALMLRVVGRLERLSESLLDFARVRPPATAPNALSAIVEEAWTLLRLDRDPTVRFVNTIDRSLLAPTDSDRMVQVFVNLLRNSLDAMEDGRLGGGRLEGEGSGAEEPCLEVWAALAEPDGRRFVTVTIRDNGPGIPPELLPTLFEPFVSSRLDARGTGLGLAVADGIVREHGGILLARNRQDESGAIFEIMLPMDPGAEIRAASGGGAIDLPGDADG